MSAPVPFPLCWPCMSTRTSAHRPVTRFHYPRQIRAGTLRAVDYRARVMPHPRAVIIWGVVYVAFLAIFVALGLNDPDTHRRAAVWPMAASLGGLAALALARTVFVGNPVGPGPWLACWLVVAALIASAGRPVRLALGTPLDPMQSTASGNEQRTAKRARLLTLLIFTVGIAIAALLRPDLFRF